MESIFHAKLLRWADEQRSSTKSTTTTASEKHAVTTKGFRRSEHVIADDVSSPVKKRANWSSSLEVGETEILCNN